MPAPPIETVTEDYNEMLNSRLRPGLGKSLALAKQTFSTPVPSQKPRPVLPARVSSSSSLTMEQRAARVELETFIRDAHGTCLSHVEWGGAEEGRRVLYLDGFPVHMGAHDGGPIMPLLDSGGHQLAKSMRVGEAKRMSLAVPSDRVDLCLIPGHHERWSKGQKPTKADKACMRTVMRLALRCGYDAIVVMGVEGTNIARECCQEQPWDCQLLGQKLGWGKEERVMEVKPRNGGASRDTCTHATLVVTTFHPQAGLPDAKAGVVAAIGTAQAYDQLLSALRAYLGLPPLDHAAPMEAYVRMLADGLEVNDKLAGGLDSLRLLRTQEFQMGAKPLHELPGRVRSRVLEDWGVETNEQFQERVVSTGKWQAVDAPEPHTPLCYVLSIDGNQGGESWHNTLPT